MSAVEIVVAYALKLLLSRPQTVGKFPFCTAQVEAVARHCDDR
ncbi:hypothetical protein [Mycobacterium simiae]|nr:hypothetical protein [Mycobacterium simiae]